MNRLLRCARWLRSLALAAVASGLFFHFAAAASLPGPLVTAAWLHAHLHDVTVLDVRESPAAFTRPPEYRTAGHGAARSLAAVGGHIPGAHLIEFGALRTRREFGGHVIDYMPPTAEVFQRVMRAAGVDAGKPVVVTSAGDGVIALDMSAWTYWALKAYGRGDVAILNGGTAAWLQAGYPVSTEAAPSGTGDWTAHGSDDARWLATSEDVAAARAHGVQLVDARAHAAFEQGHIRGARSFPTDVIVRKAGLAAYFLSPADYRTLFTKLRIDAAQPTITYCETGLLSAGAWFVLHEVMANAATRWYVGSMHEWLREGRPVVQGGP